jgi:hypothetical protein
VKLRFPKSGHKYYRTGNQISAGGLNPRQNQQPQFLEITLRKDLIGDNKILELRRKQLSSRHDAFNKNPSELKNDKIHHNFRSEIISYFLKADNMNKMTGCIIKYPVNHYGSDTGQGVIRLNISRQEYEWFLPDFTMK